jgi:hypothetical protein
VRHIETREFSVQTSKRIRHLCVFYVKSMGEMVEENELQKVLVPCFIHDSILTKVDFEESFSMID